MGGSRRGKSAVFLFEGAEAVSRQQTSSELGSGRVSLLLWGTIIGWIVIGESLLFQCVTDKFREGMT